jgi:peroxiredoxin
VSAARAATFADFVEQNCGDAKQSLQLSSGTGGAAAAVGNPAARGPVRVGDLVPDFILNDMSGKPVCLSTLRKDAKVTLILFWSYFCFPCQGEMPLIESLHRQEKESGLAVVAISLDRLQDENFVRPFLEKNDITFPVLYDRETVESYETAERFGVVGTPTIFILDDSGRVRFTHLGRLEPDLLKGILSSVKSKSYCADIVKPVTTAPTGEEPPR